MLPPLTAEPEARDRAVGLTEVAAGGFSVHIYGRRDDGQADILVIPDGILPVASLWRFRPAVDFLAELAGLGRLILFDRRGLGSSSPAPTSLMLSDWADDARDVLQGVGAKPAVVVGLAEGAMTGVALAALHPGRVAALVLLNATPGPSLAALTRSGEGPRYIDFLRSALQGGWPARMPGMQLLAPSLGRDSGFSAWVAQAFSEAGDHRRFLPAYDLALRADVRGLLARVRVPTLIVHRRDDAWFSTEHGRLLARLITGSRYLELPGADHPAYVGDAGAILRAVRWFVLDEVASRRASEKGASRAVTQPLSPRQEEVLWLVREGLSDLEIAEQLRLSPRTVQKHLEHAYRLLGVRNRTAAAMRIPSLARRSADSLRFDRHRRLGRGGTPGP